MSLASFLAGPKPPYNNPAIQPQFYKPKMYVIEDIILGITTIVTTTIDHDYVIGQNIRLLIPSSYGTIELNEVIGLVIDIPASNQVTLNVSSIGFNSFVNSAQPTQAQIVAIGDINSGAINDSGNVNNIEYILGSFINISPL